MKRNNRLWTVPRGLAVVLFLVGSLGCSVLAAAAQPSRTPKPLTFEAAYGPGPVFVVPVEGMIDNGLAQYLDRALTDAEAAEAALVVLHMDTFGGLVAAADEIRQRLLDAERPTVAFIDKNAASAGALISYAADRIVMVPGASIGAATVVDGVGGEAAPDKYQSYMRSQMRATAEANGRDPQIAEAMVDQDIEIEGVTEAGKVLTLSAQEALRLGVADAVIEDLDALLAAFELGEAERVAHRATRSETILRFFGSPVMQSLLMLMMMGGLYFELQTPGVGFAGLMAAIGAALFFGPHYVLGLVESWEIVVFALGVVLLLVEIFVIPGFGVAGIAGILCVVAALFFSLIPNISFSMPSGESVASAVSTLAVTMVLLVILLFSMSRYLPRSERFNQLVLAPELTSAAGYTANEIMDELIGRHGVTLTPLRPAGAADIEGERVDVITGGEFIASGVPVKVVKVRGNRVEVRPVQAIAAANETSAA